MTVRISILVARFATVLAIAIATTGGSERATAEDGAASVREAPVSVDGVRKLLQDGRYEEAEAAARTLLATTEESTGCESLETADVLDALVESLVWGGKAQNGEAAELAERAVGVREKALGTTDAGLVRSLIHAGNARADFGDGPGARRHFERALALAVEVRGPDDELVAHVLTDFSALLAEREPGESERLIREALRIVEMTKGPESVFAADVMGSLAARVTDRGSFDEAETLYIRGLRIYETLLGPRHPNVARSYNNLGHLHTQTGDFERARTELEQALAIKAETIGRAHPSSLGTLGNLAILEAKLGLPVDARWQELIALADEAFGSAHWFPASVRANYAVDLAEIDPQRAIRLNEEAYAVFLETFGPTHPRSLWVLTNLGSGARRVGDLSTARRLLEEAVRGLENADGAPPGLYGGAVQSLATCRAEAGEGPEARSLHERALASLERVFGGDNPEVASALVEYATFLRKTGELGAAEPVLARALAIRERALGASNPTVGDSLFALADVKTERGRFDEAEPLFRRALEIQERARTPGDPRNATGYRAYASFLLKRGDGGSALDAALRAESISNAHLRRTLAGLPERQALGLVAKTPSSLGVAVSAAITLNQPTAAAKALDAVVRSRALVLDEMAERQRSLRGENASGSPELLAKYAAARDRLARLTVIGEDEKSPQKYRARLEKARAEKEAAEHALADQSWEFRESRSRASAGLEEVARALPRGAGLVAFVRYPRVPGPSKGQRGTGSAPPVDSYAAFVVAPASRAVTLVPLGPAEAIDAAAASVRDSLARTASSLGGPSGAPAASYRRVAAALRELVWSPLQPHLAGAKSVLVVPDGSLRLVSFASLPVGADSWLVETGPVLHYLSAERDVVALPPASGVGLFLAGAPDFDAAPLPAARTQTASLRGPVEVEVEDPPLHRGPPASCRDFASLRFVELHAAARELEEVAALWRGASRPADPARRASREGAPVVLSGAAAHERAVKRGAPGRRVLHLTTHGFFLGDCAKPPEKGKAKSATTRASALYAENPLLLSGLALAGANQRGAAPPGTDDGILTAEEVASLDLSGVEWAVLSACETGLGEARAGEGLFGLRRAFQLAGARTLVTSLWPVEDESSRRWMKALYEGRLSRGLSTAEAVHEASLAVLRERRAAGQSTHPFFWAGFVAAGDWR